MQTPSTAVPIYLFLKMEEIMSRVVIKYLIKKRGMKAKEIHDDFQNTLEDFSPSYSTVAKWTNKFKFVQVS